MEPELFPLFLKIAARKCLVVGGGKIAEAKIASLVRCGAKVRVVAPSATEGIRRAAEAGAITWERRTFAPSDLADVFMVIAATSSPELHEQIFRQAQRDGILCNAVDEPERCDFYYPAVVRRGALQIAISTGGRAPALAQRLRQDLEAQFGAAYGTWVEELGRARGELMNQEMVPEERQELLRGMVSHRAFEVFKQSLGKTDAGAALQANGGDTENDSKNDSQHDSQLHAKNDMESKDHRGKVYFLGAGPGDPELLTRRAWKILRSADVVLHDALVAPEVIKLAREGATVCDVGKRCGQKSITQEEIHALMIAHASEGRTVVRLQGGDPLIFGRAGEEMSALQAAGINFEIVPGVTAASAAAAAVRIPLTDRRLASTLIFASAHRRAGNAPENSMDTQNADERGSGGAAGAAMEDAGVGEAATEDASGNAAGDTAENGTGNAATMKSGARQRPNAGLPGASVLVASPNVGGAGTTLAIYMPGLNYGRIARDLLEAGWAADTNCVVVSQASTAQQRVCRAQIGSLSQAERLPAPAILIVGDVAGTALGSGSDQAAHEENGRQPDEGATIVTNVASSMR